MPPLAAALPAILGAVSAAAGAGELGLGIYDATKGSPKAPVPAPVNTIPGSPLTTVSSSTGAGGLPPNGVLGQIIGSKSPSASGGLTPGIGGAGGGGGVRSASAPAGIAGSGGDIGTLPWITGAASPSIAPAPGTPEAM